MKTLPRYSPLIIVALSLGLTSGCSSSSKKTGQDLSPTGPTIVSTEAVPATIELDSQWQLQEPATVTAQVKDFTAPVENVTLRFMRAPLEIPMDQIGETAWRATLSPEQIRLLAVGGETMTYDANIVATNEEGVISVSAYPIQISVKAPEAEVATGSSGEDLSREDSTG